MTSPRQMIIALLIVAVACAIILAFVYAFTAPRIAETKSRLTLQGLKETINAQQFIPIIPDTLWQAKDSLNNLVGIVFRVFPRGYAGLIPITVGLDLEGKITGLRVAGASEGLKETPGLGSKIAKPDFTKQFIGKQAAEVAIKRDGGKIEAITAATISSRAVCKGVKDGIEKYRHYLHPSPDIKTKLFSRAQEFKEIIKDTLWFALKDDDTLGIVFLGVTYGYLDTIKFMVGMDKEEKITGIEIIYSKETKGIGEKIRDREFLDKFKEQVPEAITGATISSEALIKAVTSARERFKEYLK